MKKFLFIIALVIMGTTFAKANVSVKNAPVTPVALAAKAVVQSNNLSATITQFRIAQKVSSGYVTDSSGQIIGWWAYDNTSGVLLIYLY